MSYRLKNTSLDHTKRFLHRRASKMQMEPVIGGRRLRIRSSMLISDELFEHNKANLELWRGWGVVDWERIGEGGAQVGDQVPSKDDPWYTPDTAKNVIEKSPTEAGHAHPHAQAEMPAAPSDPFAMPQESTPAETTSKETRPQPKSPFKGKKQ